MRYLVLLLGWMLTVPQGAWACMAESDGDTIKRNRGTLTATPAVVIPPPDAIPAAAPAPAAIINNQKANNRLSFDTVMSECVDTTSFDSRYRSFRYHYLVSFDSNPDTTIYLHAYMDPSQRRSTYHGPKSVAVTRNKNLVKLNLVSRESTDTSNYAKIFFSNILTFTAFPELKCFRNYRFCIHGYRKNQEFRSDYIKNMLYNDVRILYTEGESFGIIELKTVSGYVRLVFDIATSRNPSKAAASVSAFSRMYRNYERMLGMRRDIFDKKIMKDYRNAMIVTASDL